MIDRQIGSRRGFLKLTASENTKLVAVADALDAVRLPVQRRRITMSNRRQFLRQTAVVGFTAGLLPSFTAANDGATRQARATFFVGGANASDNNPGTASQPFATIQAAANVAQPGDVVKIRGGIYRETVVPANSGEPDNPIMFEADDGAEPVISGADLLQTSWQPASHPDLPTGNPVYEAEVSLPMTGYADVSNGNTDLLANQIFVRSKMMPEARWPKMSDTDDPMKDHAYTRVLPGPVAGSNQSGVVTWNAEGNMKNRVNDAEIPNIPGGWTGGRIKLLVKFLPSDQPIVNAGNGFVTWQPHQSNRYYNDVAHQIYNGAYGQNADFRYYLFGRLGALSAENEWFYDGEKLYLWAPGGKVPAEVEYKARNHGFDLTGRSHITIKGLNFFACEIPTNGNSLWPTGHGIANPHRGNAMPAPSNGIVIDGCRFKYFNHFQTLRVPSENEWEEIRDLRILHHNPISRSHLNETGVRLTGDDCIVRNSVFSHSAGAGIVATGRNCLIENNYLKDTNYQGTEAGAIITTPYSNGARILRNTLWRMGRSGIDGPGPYQEVAYNDISDFTKINIDGGGNYGQGRWNNADPATATPNTLGGMPWDGTESGHFKGLNFHHNWCHDAGSYKDNHALGAGIYFDDAVDGATIHHNVTWNCVYCDMRCPNDRLDLKKTPLGISFIYNNTFGTPEGGTPEQPVRMMGPNNCQLNSIQYRDAPQSINNNIYMNRQSVGPTPLRASELAVGREKLDPSGVFVDPTGRSGGLGFQLKAGSPAINRGVPVNGTIDATGKPIDYVDDFDGPAPDCGAYEFGKEPWVPGFNLPQEFIEGQPWERQWDSKRKF
jgi:hypothetical protein